MEPEKLLYCKAPRCPKTPVVQIGDAHWCEDHRHLAPPLDVLRGGVVKLKLERKDDPDR